MTWKKIPEDAFFPGVILGALLLAVSYGIFSLLRSVGVAYYADPYFFPAPRVQLFCIVVNVVAFRFLVVRFNREQTGKGLLMITVIAAFSYFYYYYKIHHHL